MRIKAWRMEKDHGQDLRLLPDNQSEPMEFDTWDEFQEFFKETDMGADHKIEIGSMWYIHQGYYDSMVNPQRFKQTVEANKSMLDYWYCDFMYFGEYDEERKMWLNQNGRVYVRCLPLTEAQEKAIQHMADEKWEHFRYHPLDFDKFPEFREFDILEKMGYLKRYYEKHYIRGFPTDKAKRYHEIHMGNK